MATKAGKKQVKGIGRGNHPNTREGRKRTQFKPGESGNPAGVPVGTKQRSTILKKWLGVEVQLSKLPPGTPAQKGTVEDQVVLALLNKAIAKGDVAAIREVLDTAHGKLTDKTEHSFDLSNLSDEDLTKLAEIRAKLNS